MKKDCVNLEKFIVPLVAMKFFTNTKEKSMKQKIAVYVSLIALTSVVLRCDLKI